MRGVIPPTVPPAASIALDAAIAEFLTGIEADVAEMGDLRNGRVAHLRGKLLEPSIALDVAGHWISTRQSIAIHLREHVIRVMKGLAHAASRANEVHDMVYFLKASARR